MDKFNPLKYIEKVGKQALEIRYTQSRKQDSGNLQRIGKDISEDSGIESETSTEKIRKR